LTFFFVDYSCFSRIYWGLVAVFDCGKDVKKSILFTSFPTWVTMVNTKKIPNDSEGNGSESMTSRIYSRMRADIISGQLEPARKLKIAELRRRYEAGASPIREALSLLTSDNLVERLDQRGFRVVEASAKEFEELLRTRTWLEETAIRKSIENGDTTWEEQIILAAYRLSRVPRFEDNGQFVANPEWEVRHKHFHMALLAACGSSILLKFCDQLFDQNTRYRHLSAPSAYPSRDINAEHGAICDAVLARNADVAVELLVEHYQRTSVFLARTA
jgi:GntR family transcriptional regulator, carbon starvation induced regulator